MLGLSTCGALFLCALQIWNKNSVTKTEEKVIILYPLNQAEYFQDLDPNKPTELNGMSNYIQGIRQPGDSLLKAWYVKTDDKWVKEDVFFRNVGGKITSIEVVNVLPYGRIGGYVTFIKGGVGYNHATIRFRTCMCDAFRYYALFYGIKE